MENQHTSDFEQLPPENSDFIPEIEIDENTGQPKKKPYQNKPYEPLSDYGG